PALDPPSLHDALPIWPAGARPSAHGRLSRGPMRRNGCLVLEVARSSRTSLSHGEGRYSPPSEPVEAACSVCATLSACKMPSALLDRKSTRLNSSHVKI